MKNLSLLGIFFIASAIVFCGVGILTVKNLTSYLGMLGERVEIVVFLNGSVTEDGKKALLEKINGMDIVEKTKYTSEAEALEDFRRYNEFSDQIKILDRNPLPATIDVYLKIKSPEAIKNTASEFRNMDGVEDVYSTSSEAENLVLIERIFNNIALWHRLIFAVFFLISAACLSMAVPKKKIIYGLADGILGAAAGAGCLYYLFYFIFTKNFKGILFFTNPELGVILILSLIAGVAVRIPKNVMEKKQA